MHLKRVALRLLRTFHDQSIRITMPRTLRFARLLLLVVLVIYWLTIALGTHASGDDLGELWLNDKVLHFGAFLGLVVLMSWTFMHRHPTAKRACGILLVALLYGVVDEITQAWIPGRHATVEDWLADCLGAAAGMAFYLGSLRRLERGEEESEAEAGSAEKEVEGSSTATAGGGAIR